jgi:glycosyltransferase involved in cell wall biosynthesis
MEVLSLDVWRERKWRLRLYGEGRERSYLERLANHYSIADRVEFRGFKNDLAHIWSENEILVMPARGEGGPMAVTEAMMHGRPCVATRCGNVGYYVRDGDTGFIADSAAVHSLGPAMERAWSARERWPEMGLAAHKWISKLKERDPVDQLVQLVEANGRLPA